MSVIRHAVAVPGGGGVQGASLTDEVLQRIQYAYEPTNENYHTSRTLESS